MKGWDAIRKARFAKQQELGILNPGTKLSAPNGLTAKGQQQDYVPWAELAPLEQQRLDDQMAGFAAMVHAMDRNIGRILAKVEQMGELNNTLILFLSDNGSCPFDRTYKSGPLDPTDPESYMALDSRWANVGNTPFRFYKRDGYEGGAKTHLMAYWPGVIRPGTIYREPAHIVDFMPTFLELAQGEYPAEVDGLATPQLDGLSLVPVFNGQNREAHRILISGYTEDKRMIRQGDWKIVRGQHGARWALYNLKKDPAETKDLAASYPEIIQGLNDAYASWCTDHNVGVYQQFKDTTHAKSSKK